MKQLLQILILLFVFNNSFSQDIIKQFKRDDKIKKDKEFIKEFQALSFKLQDNVSIDLNTWDTIYIIRGVDITSRTGYGMVWKSSFKIEYVDYKKWTGGKKLLEPNPQFKVNPDVDSFSDFNYIIPYIESWDTSYVTKYVKTINEQSTILGGLYWWHIIKLEKGESKFIIDQFWVPNFAVLRP